ncbi:MAG TPA: transposase family protein [Ktedonobacteraceae bacterium]|nr:transposase family protein [Ktedonobacteraceae bacterium]
MRNQHIIESQPEADQLSQGIVVPLDLPELRILKQSLQADGSIEVHVIATTNQEVCPRCATLCIKIHDTRGRVKRDSSLRGHRVHLVLYKRRFRCLTCRRSFTEPDTVCGRYKRTTKRWREQVINAEV